MVACVITGGICFVVGAAAGGYFVHRYLAPLHAKLDAIIAVVKGPANPQ